MMAAELGYPIAHVVLAEPDDLALHIPRQPEHRRTSNSATRESLGNPDGSPSARGTERAAQNNSCHELVEHA
jgi:hypothetical protein